MSWGTSENSGAFGGMRVTCLGEANPILQSLHGAPPLLEGGLSRLHLAVLVPLLRRGRAALAVSLLLQDQLWNGIPCHRSPGRTKEFQR